MSGILVGDLKYQVVEPALVAIGLMTTAGLNLVTGTALAESAAGASGLVQHPSGPALGIFQIEPATEQDIWTNFLAFNPQMANQVQAMLSPGATTPQLVWNVLYGAAIARIKYWRSPLALPTWDDAAALSQYHKAVYNSALGAADATANVPLFQAAIDA